MFVPAAHAESEEYREFWSRLGRGEPIEGEFERRNKAGGTLWLQAIYTPSGLANTLNGRWRQLAPPQRVIVSNVGGPSVASELSGWIRDTWRKEMEYVTAQPSAYGVTNAYTEPACLGADRWAALIGAHRKFSGPVCVVDCGTALTIDALAEDGEHLGGLIIPGIGLMRRSLSDSTNGIDANVSGDISLLARRTSDAVTAGTLYAAVAVIDRVVSDVEAELNRDLACVITGGDAQSVYPLLARNAVYEPTLVLEGLAAMAEGGSR